MIGSTAVMIAPTICRMIVRGVVDQVRAAISLAAMKYCLTPSLDCWIRRLRGGILSVYTCLATGSSIRASRYSTSGGALLANGIARTLVATIGEATWQHTTYKDAP